MSVTPLRTENPPADTVMTALLELYHDSPGEFEDFARWASRAGRPVFGSVKLTFQDRRLVYVEKTETKKRETRR